METGKYALNITYTKITETQVINLHQMTATLTEITFYIEIENNNPVFTLSYFSKINVPSSCDTSFLNRLV